MVDSKEFLKYFYFPMNSAEFLDSHVLTMWPPSPQPQMFWNATVPPGKDSMPRSLLKVYQVMSGALSAKKRDEGQEPGPGTHRRGREEGEGVLSSWRSGLSDDMCLN